MRDNLEQPIVRGVGYLLLSIAIVVSIVTLRLMSDGNTGLKEAERAMEKGDRDAAIVALENAAKAYVPGGRHVPRALRELSVLARSAEMRGDDEKALKIWEVTRRAILATRHFFVPHKEALSEAEKEIVRIRQKGELSISPQELIKRPEDPSPFLSLVLFVGLAAWIGGAAVWVVRPTRRDGGPAISQLVSVAVCLGGLTLWLLAAWMV